MNFNKFLSSQCGWLFLDFRSGRQATKTSAIPGVCDQQGDTAVPTLAELARDLLSVSQPFTSLDQPVEGMMVKTEQAE